MNTLTKEWLQNTITSIESARDEIPFGLDEDQNNMLTALKIALASLEAEPEHWKVLNELNGIIGIYNDRESAERKAAEWRTNRIIPLYTAPPAPVVPSTQAEAFIAAIEEEQERLFDEDYLMDSKDCIEVIREESKRWADTRRELEQPLSAQQAGSVSN
ncbi:hypothetical protein [Escherichia albertii]|uniref:hypothetical protein n=1 Tax=Escherichia albertii TaxID=208962 RepID=UPI001FAA5420|nr:hypothetical protein [Escherichia albertii]MCZ8661468.1 hypothetical protein [Escherichia albertii]MCZ9009724.1 hypothetical protein [Escherichia albertii]